MLAALSIRNIILIDRLDVEFAPGLSVLTGETGAGKSILLDALALALGARGDASLVRHGSEAGEVAAVFEIAADHPVWRMLEENGIPAGDALILRRSQQGDGRTRAFINDRPVSAQLLKSAGAMLVEIHGQHDDRALVDPAMHRALLDAFGGLGADAARVRLAWSARRAALEALEAHRKQVEAARRDQEFLRHAADELARLDPKTDEEDELAVRRQQMMQAEKVADDLRAALDSVGGDGAAVARLSAAWRGLERRAQAAPALLAGPVEALDKALQEAGEAQQALEAALEACAFDPQELEDVEQRLFALRGAARKHGVAVAELPALREKIAGELGLIDAGEAELETLEESCAEAEAAYMRAAAELSDKRAAAAESLQQAVAAELPPLKLERARFLVHIECRKQADAGPAGFDHVEYRVQTNPGSAPGPLLKIASGGELSRFILALKVALADTGSAPTLIFDEVDTAVGGAVADAIGQRLARLSEKVQVLSVTHAPQVAARAGQHLHVVKQGTRAEEVVTRLAQLDAGRRQEEIARMLSAEQVTDEARAQARRLLAGA